MARVQTIVCDRCSAKDDATHVIPWNGKRGTQRVQGDLCQKCWEELLTMFRPAPAARSGHQIILTDPKKIR